MQMTASDDICEKEGKIVGTRPHYALTATCDILDESKTNIILLSTFAPCEHP